MSTTVKEPYWFVPGSAPAFPAVESALDEPNGLLAVGGELAPEWLINAYREGIFPWYCDDQPLLWWSPCPRMVLFPSRIKISRSLRRRLKRRDYQVTMDHAFAEVITACAAPRNDQAGTWIDSDISTAYQQLNQHGYAHSVEVWQEEQLIGGLYGVAMGKLFFGESMFSRATDASKIALVYLACQLQKWQFKLIDCQVSSPHLQSLGAEEISRPQFIATLHRYRDAETDSPTHWAIEPGLDPTNEQ